LIGNLWPKSDLPLGFEPLSCFFFCKQVDAFVHTVLLFLDHRKVAGSIPDDVIGIFHWHNPFGRTMVLGSIQPLTEMSTNSISWRVKAAGA
jgi:hypothetical protein